MFGSVSDERDLKWDVNGSAKRNENNTDSKIALQMDLFHRNTKNYNEMS